MKRIIISGYTPYPLLPNDARLPHISQKISKQIHKTALGAEGLVPFEYIEDINSWLADTNEPVIGLEQTAESIMLKDFSPPEAFTLMLGEEVSGIEQELLNYCTSCIEIPMVGKKESFNVSVATGIALYGLLN